jgi:signal peptide peptidase SppA
MNYSRVCAEIRSRVWAVREETFADMQQLVARWSLGEKFSQEEVGIRIADANARNGMIRGDRDIYREPEMLAASGGSRRGGSGGGTGGIVALIPVLGVITNRANMFSDISAGGGTSVEKLTSQFRSAISNPGVKAICLDIDSPGGSVDGVFELAQEIYEARGRKKIIAICNTLCASAAYAIGAAASELVIAPSGMAGSIGVFSSHEDRSEELRKQGVKISFISAGKYKTEGSPTEPLAEEARADLQAKVNDFYQMFVRGVAQYRHDSQSNVRDGYGQGRVVTAAKAVKANLADRVGTLDDVLLRLGVSRPGMSMPRDTRMLDGSEDYKSALASRRRQLALSAAGTSAPIPDDEDEDDETPCGCACEPCEACTGAPDANAHADGMSCSCACNACKACENKGGARSYKNALRRRRQLLLAAQGTLDHAKSQPEPDFVLALARRRRQLEQIL